MRFGFIRAEKAYFPVKAMCRILQVKRSGYYTCLKRPKSVHSREDEALVAKIKVIHRMSKGVYGSPRIHEEMKAQGFDVGRKRIARLMRKNGITGTKPKRFRRTTDSSHGEPVAENVLDRRFEAEGPDQAWVTDITYIRTWEGWVYLAVVIDLFSRRVVGWSMAEHMRLDLALDALRMALGERMPQHGNLVHHSDRGSQYASGVYRKVLEENGITCSMSRKGDCWDNAVAESFFATLKKELIFRHSWPTINGVMTAVREYIALFYNPRRRHSFLGFLSPMEYERLFNMREHGKAA